LTGGACHVLAGGPSLVPWLPRRDWSTGNVIGCNGIPLLVPDVPIWLMIDPLPGNLLGWAQSNKRAIKYCTAQNSSQVPNGRVIPVQGKAVMDDPWAKGFFFYHCVAHAACHLAWSWGIKTILVWGLDYQDHADAWGGHGPSWDMDKVEEGWKRLRDGLRDLGSEVLNCNPQSALKALPLVDPNLAIGDGYDLAQKETVACH